MSRNRNTLLITLVCAFLLSSMVFFFTLSSITSLQKYGNTYEYFLHQFLLGFLPAIVLGALAYVTPLSYIKRVAPWLVLVNIVFLFLVFIPQIGARINGASRWINIAGYHFQPSEFLKVTAILYLAAWIASRLSDENSRDWKDHLKKSYHNIISVLLPFIIFLGIISVGLILQKDASTLGIISLTLLVMYFSSKTPLWHTGLIVFLGVAALLLMVKLEPYRLDRWLVFLHPSQDPLGKGFQLNQSIIALGSGGWFGRGLGMSIEKFGYLPQAMSDSIFGIIGEELGFVGCVVLIAMFITFLLQGIKIYRNSHDTFSRLTAIGITFWITLQACVNMASVSGVFPLAGIPLPFYSFGGSHLVVEMIGVGLLLNISKHS